MFCRYSGEWYDTFLLPELTAIQWRPPATMSVMLKQLYENQRI